MMGFEEYLESEEIARERDGLSQGRQVAAL